MEKLPVVDSLLARLVNDAVLSSSHARIVLPHFNEE